MRELEVGTARGGHAAQHSGSRERVLWVAAGLFAAQGYHATGMSELGAAAGLGRGALCHHIGSKEQLLYELTARHVERMVDFGQEVLASDLDTTTKLQRLSRACCARSPIASRRSPCFSAKSTP